MDFTLQNAEKNWFEVEKKARTSCEIKRKARKSQRHWNVGKYYIKNLQGEVFICLKLICSVAYWILATYPGIEICFKRRRLEICGCIKSISVEGPWVKWIVEQHSLGKLVTVLNFELKV